MFDKLKEKKYEYADYMTSTIANVIGTCGKRYSGSEGETEAALYFERELKKYADETCIESYPVYPESFYGWVPWTASFLLASIAALFFIPLLAILLIVVGLVPMLVNFIMYRKELDPLWRKATSHNVTAIRKPTGEVKQAIYFNGHMDAAKEWTLNHKFGGKMMTAIVILGFFSLIYIFGVAVFRLVSIGAVNFEVAHTGLHLALCCGAFAFFPCIVAVYFLSDNTVTVDGANDDLSGCLSAVAILKALSDEGITFEHTQVGVIITGSEEVGLRGAKAWSVAHKKECEDIPTEIICFDTITEPEFLIVNLNDLNGTVLNDRPLCDKYLKTAQDLSIACSFGGVPIGSSDAAAFSQARIPATSVTAMNHDIPKYYHTRADNVSCLNRDCLADVFSINMELLKNYD